MGAKPSKNKKSKKDAASSKSVKSVSKVSKSQEHNDEITEIINHAPPTPVSNPNKPSVEAVNIKAAEESMEKSGSEVLRAIIADEANGELLKKVPLFSRLNADERAQLGGAMLRQELEADTTIFEQGDPGEAFYIIMSGNVTVLQKDGETTHHLADLKQGDYFGEASLLTKRPRDATIKTLTKVVALTVRKKEFDALFVSKRIIVPWATRRAAISAERLSMGNISATPQLEAVSEEQKVKTVEERQLIKEAVSVNLFFENLDEDHIEKVIDEMYKVEYKAGEKAIEKNVVNFCLYVVNEGTFTQDDEAGPIECGPGKIFGAVALLYGGENHNEVVATTGGECWAIDRFKFQTIAKDIGQSQLGRYTEFLANVELLIPLSAFEREKIAEALEEKVFAAGEVIIKQGDDGDCMFIVESGTVSCSSVNAEGEKQELCTYGAGEYFGDRALLTTEKRAATLTANEETVCVTLDRGVFSLLLGPLEDIFTKRLQSYVKEKPKPREWKPIDCKLNELKILGTLGKGSFGFVSLVSHGTTGNYYALKAVSKANVVRTKQQGHIMSEKTAMCELYHPCLVNLMATFNTDRQLFFLLEVGMGGDLFTHLRKERMFVEGTARFFAASVIAGFEFMHSHDTIYRDLKPENLLLDDKGFLKITDFGFAKKITGKTWTLCGTPEYLCPEIVAGKGHGFGVDWWTVGILIYELLVSYTPFYHRNQLQMYRKIAAGRMSFPCQLSPEARDIITSLLNTRPVQRLGSAKGGGKAVREHPWFNGFNWKALVGRKMTPPYAPKELKTPKNLSRETPPEPTPYEPDPANPDWDKGF